MAKINYSAAELDAAIAAAQNVEGVTFDAAQINTYLQSAKDVDDAMGNMLPIRFYEGGNNTYQYCIFARSKKSTWGASNHFAALVVSVGNYSNVAGGIYLCEGNCRSNTVGMKAYQLAATGSGTPVFGHYDGGDGYEYFGVCRSTYSNQTIVWPLQWAAQDGTTEFALYARQTAAPTGWTTISIS